MPMYSLLIVLFSITVSSDIISEDLGQEQLWTCTPESYLIYLETYNKIIPTPQSLFDQKLEVFCQHIDEVNINNQNSQNAVL
jgi:hypothetical protein